MIFKTPVVTPRLLLKKKSLNDFERFYAMSKDPEVMKYIGDGSIFHWSKKIAFEKFKASLFQKDGCRIGTLAVYIRDQDLYIGTCEIRHSKFLDHIELGYRFCRDAWNNGYATEAAYALIAETYRRTVTDRILACTHPQNTASIRVLEKLRFVYIRSKYSRASDQMIPVYELNRKRFDAITRNG